jgi:hypothetical protein
MRKIIFVIITLLFFSGGIALAALKDNGDGTVTDNSTGLMWQKATAPDTYYWFDAKAYCENLILAAHEDWRLPDLDELQSLVYWSSGTPSDAPTIDPLLASNTVADYYWSSDFEQKYGQAWRVSFSKSGYDWSVSILNAYYVRAVRGGSRALSISKSGDGEGTVSSVPLGINCGSQCSSSFDYATVVTLKATPDSLSVFTGWSGGDCSGTSTTCQVSMDVSETITATFTLETTDPTGTVTINDGAAYTTNAAVTLTLSASDTSGISQMKFSNDGTTWSIAETYGTTKVWPLSDGDGLKTVYVMYKDNAGNWSTPVLTTITLDTTAPVTSATPRGGEYRTKQNVTLSANEPAIIYYTANGAEPTATSPTYAATPILITDTTSLKFFAQDNAGNLEIVRTELYTINENGMPGEMNNDTRIDLADAILALQVSIRQTSRKGISNYITADVNDDGKIGLAETIYILQTVAGIR